MGGNAASLRRHAAITPPSVANDCEIPAYAGMVCEGNESVWAYFGIIIRQIVVHNSPQYAPFPSLSPGPFLRKQESHNHLPPSAASLRRQCRPVKNRFLPTQEWATGGRESIGEYGIVVAKESPPPNPYPKESSPPKSAAKESPQIVKLAQKNISAR